MAHGMDFLLQPFHNVQVYRRLIPFLQRWMVTGTEERLRRCFAPPERSNTRCETRALNDPVRASHRDVEDMPSAQDTTGLASADASAAAGVSHHDAVDVRRMPPKRRESEPLASRVQHGEAHGQLVATPNTKRGRLGLASSIPNSKARWLHRLQRFLQTGGLRLEAGASCFQGERCGPVLWLLVRWRAGRSFCFTFAVWLGAALGVYSSSTN